MKPFKSTLQAIRTLRVRQEREAMEAYAHALLDRVRSGEKLQSADRALAAGQWEWQQRVSCGCPAAELVHHQLHCRELAARRSRCLALAKESESRADVALQSMMLARQEREIVDKFSERQRAIYDRELNRAEQKFLDELACRRTDAVLASSGALLSSS
jgi:flagellar export protein FliJ